LQEQGVKFEFCLTVIGDQSLDLFDLLRRKTGCLPTAVRSFYLHFATGRTASFWAPFRISSCSYADTEDAQQEIDVGGRRKLTIWWTRRMYWRRASIQDGQAFTRNATSAWWRHCSETVFPR